jgi:dolichyl-phosphate-mannose-protein mannosyltransferase
VFGVVFMTSALWGTWAWLRTPPARAFVPLVRIGLFLGLAVATKWNAVYASVLVGAVVIARTVRLAVARNVAPAEKDAAVRAHVAGITLGMLLLPALVYLAVYVPFFLTGHDFAQWIELQRQIYWYHSHLRETHTYQSKWWEWPLTLRPVWYSVTWASGRIAHVYANGNLFLYALFVPAVIATAIRRAKSDGAAVLVLLIGFFGQWLPWMLVPRIAFIYHFLPAAVFGSFALAWLASDLFERGGWPRRLALGYLALVAANFVYFYPIRAAVPLRPEAVEQRMWLKRWH